VEQRIDRVSTLAVKPGAVSPMASPSPDFDSLQIKKLVGKLLPLLKKGKDTQK
jgi:hypothetical protein